MLTDVRPGEPVPLYYQLELALRERIEAGKYDTGEPIPGEQDLAEQFQVSRITVRRALDRLEEDGLILRRRGARTQVVPGTTRRSKAPERSPDFRGFEDEMQRLGLEPHAKVLESTVGAPSPLISALLAVPSGENVVRIRRLGIAKGIPLWIESRYFPLSVGQALLGADVAGQSIQRLLSSKLGLTIARVEAQLEAVAATARQAQLLELATGSPLLLHQSVTFQSDGHPIQVLRAYLRGESYKLVLRAVPNADKAGLELTGGGYLVGGGPLDSD